MTSFEQDLRFCRNSNGDFEVKNMATAKSALSSAQQKIFVQWINSKIKNENLAVTDLFVDLRDGRILHALLCSLSGEILPKLSKGNLRIHRLENVRITLEYLKNKGADLLNIGCQDIVDGNPNITLGLIWSIIVIFDETSSYELYAR